MWTGPWRVTVLVIVTEVFVLRPLRVPREHHKTNQSVLWCPQTEPNRNCFHFALKWVCRSPHLQRRQKARVQDRMMPIENTVCWNRVGWTAHLIGLHGAAVCALPLVDYYIFLGTTWKTMADEHFRTPVQMPGTHSQNICDQLLQSTFSSARWERFHSSRYRVQRIRDNLFNGLS